MNNYEKYMNYPDIVDESMPMREIHAVRLMIYDETKNMTPAEHSEYFNKAAQEAIEKYGLKVKPREAKETIEAV
jgi:hypothetical protein